MAYGKVEYNEEGEPKCEICGKHFKRVLTHVRQKHEMLGVAYRKKFGLDLSKGICSKESSEKTSLKTLGNFDKCVQGNLLVNGSQTRFVKGSKGRTKESVSEQTKIRLKERLKESYMVTAMVKSGVEVGKSGLGNQKRWATKVK